MEEKEPSDGLLLDFCPTCGGAWLDAGEMERFGKSVAAAFKEQFEHAAKTLLPTPFPCPRCSKPMDRAWMAQAEVELKVCPGCMGAWIDRARLLALRVHLKRLAAAAAVAAAAALPAPAPAFSRRARILAACGVVVLFWSARRVISGSTKGPAAPPAEAIMSVADYERAALTRLARASSAEVQGRLEEAEDEYKSAAEYYYAAILVAGGSPAGASDVARLEIEYAKVGEPIARIAVRLGRLDEAEEIQKVRLAVFERHRLTEEQAATKKNLAQIRTARKAAR